MLTSIWRSFEKAVEGCNKFLAKYPNEHNVLTARACANLRLGRLNEAALDAETALRTGNENAGADHFVLGALDILRGNVDSAIEHLDVANRLQPERPLNFVLRALARFRRGDVAATLQDIDQAIAMCPTQDELNRRTDGRAWQVYKLRGIVRLTDKRNAQNAIGDFTRAIELKKADAESYALRAYAHLLNNDWKLAYADFDMATQLDPKQPIASPLLVRVLTMCPDSALRDGKRALSIATVACERTGFKNGLCLSGLAAAYAETGDFENAVLTQEKVVKLSDDAGRCPSTYFGTGTFRWWHAFKRMIWNDCLRRTE